MTIVLLYLELNLYDFLVRKNTEQLYLDVMKFYVIAFEPLPRQGWASGELIAELVGLYGRSDKYSEIV